MLDENPEWAVIPFEEFLRLVESSIGAYRGYSGKLEYDQHGKIFTGEVVEIGGVVTFHGRTIDEIRRSFKESINLYIEMREKNG